MFVLTKLLVSFRRLALPVSNDVILMILAEVINYKSVEKKSNVVVISLCV